MVSSQCALRFSAAGRARADAVLGVEAAKRAGMTCVGIDRHDDPRALARADVVVKDLAEVDCDKIKALLLKADSAKG